MLQYPKARSVYTEVEAKREEYSTVWTPPYTKDGKVYPTIVQEAKKLVEGNFKVAGGACIGASMFTS